MATHSARFDLTEHYGRFNFAENEYPAWSPSGTKLAFIREGDVWLAQGEDEKDRDDGGYAQDWSVSRIAASARYDGHTVGGSHWIVAATGVSWAPDEKWLVYGAERISGSGQNDLHLLRRDKEEWQDTLLKSPGDTPSVSPDGRWILYTSRGTVFAMTPDQKSRFRWSSPLKTPGSGRLPGNVTRRAEQGPIITARCFQKLPHCLREMNCGESV